MTAAAIALATLRFAAWELALFAAAIRCARILDWRENCSAAERWLAILAIQVTLESSFAAIFSFTGHNSSAAYWIVAAVCLAFGAMDFRLPKAPPATPSLHVAWIAALLVPLLFLSFKPVEEIDSINYLHYLIDWMGNRATPYTFATNYVAFWELTFLPAWTVTRVDLFFPLLAAKAVVLLALGAWLAGRELEVPCPLLLWTVCGSMLMRHYWYLHSGIPTLKNDALHGAGFVLLALVVLRAARKPLAPTDWSLLAFGASFAAVKYTGVFVAVIAVTLVVLRRRPKFLVLLAAGLFFVLTSGHYYIQNWHRDGSPFYPFQINIGFIHLPGTADLSNTSILYSLHDPRLWRALFLPAGGISPAGLLFPMILPAILLTAAFLCARALIRLLRNRNQLAPLEWGAFLILCGWLLYFRSVFSASGYAGDLSFILNNLNSIRYVDGVLALSEVLLVALLARIPWVAWPLVAINAASRALDLYSKIPARIFPPLALGAAAALTLLLMFFLLPKWKRYWTVAAIFVVLAGTPYVVQRNRQEWTTYWDDLKPSLEAVRDKDIAELALTDGGYFAGHVVAAGNPVNPAIRTLLPEDLDSLAPGLRPRYLAVLVTSGSEAATTWRSRYGSRLAQWGYIPKAEFTYGALLERRF